MKTKTASSLSSASPRHIVSEGTTNVRIQATHLDLADIVFETPDKVKTVTLFATTVTIGNKAVIHLPGEVVTIVADRLEGTGGTINLKTECFYFHFRECNGRVKIASPGSTLKPEVFNGKNSRSVKRDAFQKDFTVINQTEKIAEHNITRKRYQYDYIIQPPKNERLTRLEEDWCTPVIPAPALKAIAPLAIPAVLDARIQGTLARTEKDRESTCAQLAWLVQAIPFDFPETEVRDLRQLAGQQLLKFKVGTKENYVPYLAPQFYEKQMSNLLKVLKDLKDEMEAKNLGSSFEEAMAVLNENIQANGRDVVKFMQAFAHKENEMAAHYEAVIAEKRSRIAKANEQIKEYGVETSYWKTEITKRLKDFEDSYKDEKLWDGILTMVGCLAAVVGAIALAVPSGGTSLVAIGGVTYKIVETISDAAKVVHGFEKFFKALEYLIEVIEAIKKIGGGKIDFKAIGDGVPDPKNIKISPDAEWDEAVNEFEASLPQGAAAERLKLVAAYRNLISWAKSSIKCLVEIIQCQTEIETNERLMEISKAQSKRLLKLKTDPRSLDKVDWAEIQLDLAVMEKMVQARVVEVFTHLARAYEYKFDTPVDMLRSQELDLIRLRLRLDKLSVQIGSASGKDSQLKPTIRKDMRVVFPDTPVATLLNGKLADCPVTIKPHLAEVFSNYAAIRVTDVQVELSVTGTTGKGKKKTSGNVLRVTTDGARREYIVEWYVSGEQFLDVTRSRKVIERSCDPLTGTSRYQSEGNQLVDTSVASWWAENTMNISPFTTWQVSVPPKYKETNSGLKLEVPDKSGKKMVPATKVDVTLIFTIEAVTVPRVVNPAGKKLALKKPAAKLAKKKLAGRAKS